MNCVITNTSNLVQFKNIQNHVINLNAPFELVIEYSVGHGVKVTGNDWVALFPEGCKNWTSLDINQMITYEFVLRQPLRVTKEEKRYKIQLSLTGNKKLKYDLSYQFIYYNKFSDNVLGISNPFKFIEPVSRDVFAVSTIADHTNNNISGKGIVKENNFKVNKNRKPSKSSVQTKEVEVKNERDIDYQEKNHGRYNKRNRLSFMNKMDRRVVHGSSSDDRLVSNSSQFPSSCSNCHRVNALLSRQAELYSQVKNLAEMNNDLNQHNCWLQKQIELGQAAYQKLSVTLMHEREWKMFYHAAAQERVDYHYQVMVVDQMHPDLFTVREPPVLERQRSIDKTKLGSVLKLKAIIGSQEEKIRSLTKEIEELKGSRVQKVKAIVKDIEKLKIDSGDLQCNRSDQEENIGDAN
uniref:SKICH domain-containing protein n=1 Tax=Cuerna arida TaxID=1464854 RepID=A0A1B6FBN0_9HEMI